MHNPRLAGRYAKSLLDMAIERQQLSAVYADMKFLSSVCKSNPDFVRVLKSPIIKADTKDSIIESITSGRVSELTGLFIRLLVSKTRESNLPEIVHSFIDQYNKLNDIHQVKITTPAPLSDEMREVLLRKIKSDTPIQKIELEAVVNPDLIGGFTMEMGGVLVDASIQRDLNDVKKNFKSNEYIHRLR